jgi:hypothetical protein
MDRALKPWELELTKRNCATYDRFRIICVRKCSNPECNYPLSALEENFFSNDFNGRICDLCHTLEDAARQQLGLRQAHEEWKQEQQAKKKMLDSKNYL